MSLDYPYYEELCRRKHRAAWWWLVGDRLYYLGLLPAMLAVPGAGVAILAGLLGFGWHWLLAAVFVFPVGVVVFVVGGKVNWPIALVMAAAAIAGGYFGAHFARRLDRNLVRRTVVAIGFVLAAYYFYGQLKPLWTNVGTQPPSAASARTAASRVG